MTSDADTSGWMDFDRDLLRGWCNHGSANPRITHTQRLRVTHSLCEISTELLTKLAVTTVFDFVPNSRERRCTKR